MTIYKADLKTNIYYTIGFVIFFGVTIPLSSGFSSSSWELLIIFLFLYILFSVATSRLNEIQLYKSNNSLMLNYKNQIGIKKTTKYDLKQIEFTYTRQATTLRGGIKKVCTIYSSDKKVIEIVPGNDDWSDDEIRNFVYELIASNVKKKFIGYSLNDVKT